MHTLCCVLFHPQAQVARVNGQSPMQRASCYIIFYYYYYYYYYYYEAIVKSGFALVSYHLIEISSSYSKLTIFRENIIHIYILDIGHGCRIP